ncbi:hypothetical protein D9M69_681570 [compost metagenome]
MDGALQFRRGKAVDAGEHGREEAFHVAGAAAVEASVSDAGLEGIAAPILSVDGHDVGVPRQHDAAGQVGADGGEQVGLGAGGVVAEARADALPAQVVAHPFD